MINILLALYMAISIAAMVIMHRLIVAIRNDILTIWSDMEKMSAVIVSHNKKLKLDENNGMGDKA